MSDDGRNAPYKVGYGKPPIHTRFQKGRCPNPGGRPKKLKSWREVLHKELLREIPIMEGGKPGRITLQEAIARKAVNSALR